MKFLLIILSFLFTSLPVFSQGAFHFKHNVTYSNEVFDIAECKEGYLLVGTSEGEGMLCYGYLLFLNHDGTIIWEKISPDYYPDNYRQYVTAVYSNNYFYIGGTVRIDEKKYSTLTKIDINGNVVFERTFGNVGVLGLDNLTRKMLLNDNGILLASSGFNETGTEGELIQIDFEGNILWNKFFSYDHTSTRFWEYFDDMKQGKDGNFVLTLSSESDTIDFKYRTIIKVKPNGEEIWKKVIDKSAPSSITPDTMYLMNVTPYKENHVLGAFIISGKKISDTTFSPNNYVFIEYDEHGNELTYKRFDNLYDFGTFNLYANKNDELFLAGNREYPDIDKLSIIKFSTYKEKEWEKFYITQDAPIVESSVNSEVFDCGTLTMDNGFMMTGMGFYMISNEFYYNATIVKTDCNGNTVWDYSSCPSPNFEDITIFPNPSAENFIIQLPNVHANDNVQLKVYDLMGKLVHNSDYVGSDVINLSSSSWATGTYICRVSINDEVVKTEKLLKE